jgi:uncharacterized membrane protein
MRDLRRYAQATNIRLFMGFLILLFLVGDGLIAVFWGWGTALMGVGCILIGLAPLFLTALILWAIEWFVKKKQDI